MLTPSISYPISLMVEYLPGTRDWWNSSVIAQSRQTVTGSHKSSFLFFSSDVSVTDRKTKRYKIKYTAICAIFFKIKSYADSSNPGRVVCEEKVKISVAHKTEGRQAIQISLKVMFFLKILKVISLQLVLVIHQLQHLLLLFLILYFEQYRKILVILFLGFLFQFFLYQGVLIGTQLFYAVLTFR